MARTTILLAALATAVFQLPADAQLISGQAHPYSVSGTYMCTGSGLMPECYLSAGMFTIDVPQGAAQLDVKVTMDQKVLEVMGHIAKGSTMDHTAGGGYRGSYIGLASGNQPFQYSLYTTSTGGLALTPGTWVIGLDVYPVVGMQDSVSASGTIIVTVSPVPVEITGLGPNAARAGGSAFTLTVNGTGFAAGSIVQWNGSPLATKYVSGTQLTATVPASLIASSGKSNVTVQNAGGLFSNSMPIQVLSGSENQYVISTVAGNGAEGYSGDGGAATSATMSVPVAVAVDKYGSLYIADSYNNCVRKLASNGIVTTVAGTGVWGYSGDGGSATSATMNKPDGVAVDGRGNIYISDFENDRIRKVAPNGIITTVVGTGTSGYSGDGGPATSAQIKGSKGLRLDSAGNLFFAEPYSNVIRKVDTNGIITTVAGNGTSGNAGDGGPATNAQLNGPSDVAVDAAGNIYIADTQNCEIRKVSATGIITTVAGQALSGYDDTDDVPATQAILDYPLGVDVDAAGNVLLTNPGPNAIREVTTDGRIHTIAGKSSAGAGYAGDGGLATDAMLSDPQGVTVGPYGRIYISDTGNNVIRMLTPQMPGVAGSLAQIASAGGWDTSLTLVNLDASPNQIQLNSYAADGGVPQLPFTFPQQPSQAAVTGATLSETLGANALMVFDTTGPASLSSTVASTQLLTSGNVGGFAIFQIQSTGQQAVVPLETRNAPSYLLAFDNTAGLHTGLALANVSAAAGSVKVVVRDDTGAVIATKVNAIPLPGYGHASFMLDDATQGFPETGGKRGTVEFDTPSGGPISVLGLRANDKSITTLPVLAQVDAAGGALAHVATGGGWETEFTLVNTGTASAPFTLNFFDENTGLALPLALLLPQTSATQTTASLTQTLAPGATLLVRTQGGSAAVTCSAQLATRGQVSGFAIFKDIPSAQEAVVPLETRAPKAFVLAYDNMNGLETGLALANQSAQAVSVPVVVRDDMGATLSQGQITLAGNGHTQFMLIDPAKGFPITAGRRGTIEFDTPSGGKISALGIRAVGATHVITTIPVLAKY